MDGSTQTITRERIAGFLLGVGVGTAIGFFLQKPDEDRARGPKRERNPADQQPGGFRVHELVPQPSRSSPGF
ncbi:MAG TPA: hypothetical protein VKR60_13355 [Candidatus Sulfotelmatobacter sp.]|nr:hypothetical protein [Candidatus Sulfotelmatobacter sp.]